MLRLARDPDELDRLTLELLRIRRSGSRHFSPPDPGLSTKANGQSPAGRRSDRATPSASPLAVLQAGLRYLPEPARDAYRRHGPTGARGADRSSLSSFAFRENLLRPVESRLAVLTDWVWGKGLMKPAGLASRLEWLLVPGSTKVCGTPKTGGSTGRSRRLLGYACQSASPQARPGGAASQTAG